MLFPTGGGKSLCYQVPALVFDGLTLVISPLVALMQDQVQQLDDRGIPATWINSSIPSYEIEQRLVNARNGMYKLLYCAPERLHTALFQAELNNLPIDLIAVDEAHCISEWGHDFRPAYRTIKSAFKDVKSPAKWIALTATATPEVKQDIIDCLEFENPSIISQDLTRSNLTWWVIHAENKKDRMRSSIKKAASKGDGLIYGGTRKNCEHWAEEINAAGIKSEAYHAGIDSAERKEIQQRWITGETPLVVSTNAFGMGIDKPDCRYVFHEQMPLSIEAYYQEAGRAGRDGEQAYPILFYKDGDYLTLRQRLQENYPTRKELKGVYDALCDSLNLAVGSEMLEMRAFELDKINTRSGIPKPIIRSSLRLMEQFDVLLINANASSTLEIQFQLSQEMMITFRERCQNPEKAEFVSKLERLFGHFSFSNLVSMELEVVLKKLDVSYNALVKALNVLMQHDQILVYSIHEENQLLKLVHPRSSELPIQNNILEKYRTNLLKKLDMMNGYATTKECREVYLRAYFGELNTERCGKCDNCSNQNKQQEVLSSTELTFAFNLLIEQKQSIHTLISNPSWTKTKARDAVRYLIEEQMIEPDELNTGYYKLIKA